MELILRFDQDDKSEFLVVPQSLSGAVIIKACRGDNAA
jgi:hypothetical protein